MTITLYQNESGENVVSKNLTVVTSLTGALREPCDILNPVIRIAGDLSQLLTANYFYIPEFARYYYLEKAPTIINNGLYEIQGKVDVLQSNAATIRANSAIVKKQTYKNNTLLNDGSFKVYQDKETVTKAFPNSFSGTTYLLMIMG